MPGGDHSREHIHDLRDAVDSSAATARSFYLTYLLLGGYIAVTIGSTSDVQLLKVAPVVLPILNVELPIVAFYALVPWLLVVIHGYLILQLYLLSRRVHLFDAALDTLDKSAADPIRASLFPFPFVHMLAGERSRLLAAVFSLIVWLTIIWLPMLLVLSAQVRFLPYHDTDITLSTRLAIGVELLILWVFWPMIVSRDIGQLRQWWRAPISIPIYLLAALRRALRWSTISSRRERPSLGFVALTSSTALVVIFSWFVATVPGEPMEYWLGVVWPAPADAADREGAAGNYLTWRLFESANAPLRRNLQLKDLLLTVNELEPADHRRLRATLTNSGNVEAESARAAVLDKVIGLDLSGRDLRNADFRRATVPHAILRGANLDGADLRGADFEGADLRPLDVAPATNCIDPAQKEHAAHLKPLVRDHGLDTDVFCAASARGLRADGARMANLSAVFALLGTASFRDTDLAGAQFSAADLHGARLQSSLAAVDLSYADLSGARVSATKAGGQRQPINLTGSSLDGASIHGVEATSLKLGSAYFVRFFDSSLIGAQFDQLSLRGARFVNVDMRRAIFTQADVTGAAFINSDLSSTDFSASTADWMSIENSAACLADFSQASARASHWDRVVADGASFVATDLRLAVLQRSRTHAADFKKAHVQPYRQQGWFVDFSDFRQQPATSGGPADDLLVISQRLQARGWTPAYAQEPLVQALSERVPLVNPPAPGTRIRTTRSAVVSCDDSAPDSVSQVCVSDQQFIATAIAVLGQSCKHSSHFISGLIRQRSQPSLSVDRAGHLLSSFPDQQYFDAVIDYRDRCNLQLDGLALQRISDYQHAIAVATREPLPHPGEPSPELSATESRCE